MPATCACGTRTTRPPCESCRNTAALEEAFAARGTPEFSRVELSWTGVKAPCQEGNSVLPDWQPLIDRRGGV